MPCMYELVHIPDHMMFAASAGFFPAGFFPNLDKQVLLISVGVNSPILYKFHRR